MSTGLDKTIKDHEHEQLEAIEELLDYYRSHPVQWVEENLGVKTWSGMRLIIDSVFANKRTSVRACHGLSKTYSAACVAVTFLALFAPSVIVTTAPTGRQVRELLWKEIRAFYLANHRLPGRCLTTTVKVDPDWYMFGFSTDRASSMEGVHGRNILFVLDEAKGLPQWIYDSMEGSLTGGNARALEISTTDGADQQCPFRQHHTTRRKGWNCIAFSAFDSPFVDPDTYPEERQHMNESLFDAGRPEHGTEWPLDLAGDVAIATEDWIEDRRDDWEEKNPYMWQTKVGGDFADIGSDAIIPLKWVLAAVDYPIQEVRGGERKYGLDVARMGDDQTVLFELREAGMHAGWKALPAIVWEKKDTMETAGITIRHVRKKGITQVDLIGVGAGVFDRMAELGHPVIGVNSSETAYSDREFANRRAEMWWGAREWFRRNYENGGGLLQIPDDAELIEELTGLKYKIASDGRILAESKPDYKKRLGRSPNRADALIYALFRFRFEEEGIE